MSFSSRFDRVLASFEALVASDAEKGSEGVARASETRLRLAPAGHPTHSQPSKAETKRYDGLDVRRAADARRTTICPVTPISQGTMP